jgi:hypothetical protein
MEYQIYTVHPIQGPQLTGWCATECELDYECELLLEAGYKIKVVIVNENR